MDTIIVTEKQLSSLDKLETGVQHNESNLYIYEGDSLMKVLYPAFRKDRLPIIHILGDYQQEGCVLPQKNVSDKNGFFMGYVMPYEKSSKTLSTIIGEPSTFEKQKRIINQIRNTLLALRKDSIAYPDIHSGNVLLDENGNTKLVDMDSVAIRKLMSGIMQSAQYVLAERTSDYYSTILSLEILFKIYGRKFDSNFGLKYPELIKIANKYEKQVLDYVGKKEAYYYNVQEPLEHFDPNHIEQMKLILGDDTQCKL